MPFFEWHYDDILFKIIEGIRPSCPSAMSPSWVEWGLTEAIWSLMEVCWKHDFMQHPSADTIVGQLSSMLGDDMRPPGGWGEFCLAGSQDTVGQQYPSVTDLDTMLWGHSIPNDLV